MSVGLREVRQEEINVELERVILPRLTELLGRREAGHCMRVSGLDPGLMASLCRALRQRTPAAQVHVLAGAADVPADVAISSTKLVELRNPMAGGALRPTLLVFIPDQSRVAVEDSFGVATFEQIRLGDVYQEVSRRLLEGIPNGLRAAVEDVLRRLSEEGWQHAGPLARLRFLLTIRLNDNDPDAAGAALFELGLIPDFEAFRDLAAAPQRITRNLARARSLTYSPRSPRGRVLELGLASSTFQSRLAEFLLTADLDEPRSWARRIAVERDNWSLAFQHWRFHEEETLGSVAIEVVSTTLPVATGEETERRIANLSGHPYLPAGPSGLKGFSVTFRTRPPAARVRGLHRFVVRIVSQEGGSVGVTAVVRVGGAVKSEFKATFRRLDRVEWEEGWHQVQVEPLTTEGDPVPVSPALRSNGARAEDHFAVSGEPFYVLPRTPAEVPPRESSAARAPSLVHAWQGLQLQAVQDGMDPAAVRPRSVRWSDAAMSGRRGDAAHLEVQFTGGAAFQIAVPRVLRDIERAMLEEPARADRWWVTVGDDGSVAHERRPVSWPASPALDAFLDARGCYFQRVLGEGRLVTQGADLCSLIDEGVAYVAAYQDLVAELARRTEAAGADEEIAIADLRAALMVDCVMTAVRSPGQGIREALLLGPTHPLRVLWLLTWSAVARAWLGAAVEAGPDHVPAVREALFERLTTMGLPPILCRSDGRALAPIEGLGLFWTIYCPVGEVAPRGLADRVAAALGATGPGSSGGPAKIQLAPRVARYLHQHPYVRTLVVNAFNPGRGSALAEMLLELQRRFEDVTYDIRLFHPDAGTAEAGADLAALFSPEATQLTPEADAFSRPGPSLLRPKLGLAVRRSEEFTGSPDRYQAHLSIVFDAFCQSQVEAWDEAEREAGILPVYGLCGVRRAEYVEAADTVLWRRWLQRGRARDLVGAESLTDLTSSLHDLMGTAVAMAATGQAGPARVPQVTLALGVEDRSLIQQVHEVSDWVITVDRNLGIEFFDHGGRADRPDFLIDHSPDTGETGTHQVFVTARSVEEIEAMFGPTLAEHGLPADGSHCSLFMDQLRFLSGQLGFKVVSGQTQRREAVGLALARLYLDYQRALTGQIVVPLDAHPDLYRRGRQHTEDGDSTLQRTDLAIFDLDAGRRLLTCRLVEVKCHAGSSELTSMARLKERIAGQLEQSRRTLTAHFDPRFQPVDRPDRSFQSYRLASLLRFYLDRACRHGVFDQAAEAEARSLLEVLEAGYELTFTLTGMVFDFERDGRDIGEMEAGVEYHRVGRDAIPRLVAAAVERYRATAGEGTRASTGSLGDLRLEVVPRLAGASFLPEPRERRLASLPSVAPVSVSEPALDETSDAEIQSRSGPAVGPAPADAEAPAPVVAPVSEGPATAEPDVLLGSATPTRQWGLLGDVAGRSVALDLNETHTISLFGVQGGGKSYTLGSVVEMATRPIGGINRLPRPLASVVFHYSPTEDYAPEFTSMANANDVPDQVAALAERYGAEPAGLDDVVLIVPEEQLAQRRSEYPGLAVRPLRFPASELQSGHWRFLMGAVGNQSVYIRQVNRIMRERRADLTLDSIRQGIDSSHLADHLKELARQRLDLAASYIDDDAEPLASLIRPGRLVLVDLRDEFIERDEALGLFVVLLQLFSAARYDDEPFNKLVVFDEAHKYIGSPDLVDGLVEVVREMRHKGTSVMIASQDPPSVPIKVIELSSQIILHRFNSPAWLRHVQKGNAALGGVSIERMTHLAPGEAFIWSSRATDPRFTQGAVKVSLRPRATRHGGQTRRAVE